MFTDKFNCSWCALACVCYVYTHSRESFSSSSFRLGSLCRPKVILRASTCSFRGLYSSCRRRVVSSSLFRSFSDCFMVLSICREGRGGEGKGGLGEQNIKYSRQEFYIVLLCLFCARYCAGVLELHSCFTQFASVTWLLKRTKK